jgi:hypothetical protein
MKSTLNFVGRRVINKHTQRKAEITGERKVCGLVVYTLDDNENIRADQLWDHWDFDENRG